MTLRFSLTLFIGFVALFAPNIAADEVECIDLLYCAPKFNETWPIGSSQVLSWNKNYGTLVANPTVDIYLYDMRNTLEPFEKWLNYENTGTLTIDVTTKYFPDVPTGITGPNLIRYYRFDIVSHGSIPKISTVGPIFKIQDNTIKSTPFATTTTTIVTTVSSTITMVPSGSIYVPLVPNFNTGSGGVSGRTIGIIVGSILGALAVGILIFFLIKRRNRTTQLPVGITTSEKDMNQPPNNVNSDSGQTADLVNPPLLTGGIPVQSTSSSVLAHNGQPVGLTENEAKLIAETYRKSLRKPGWENEEEAGQSSSDLRLL